MQIPVTVLRSSVHVLEIDKAGRCWGAREASLIGASIETLGSKTSNLAR
jgi:hypothetical protein